MNRLVLIGNGFDLAHGFKTSYSDFILDYFQNAIGEFFKEDVYSDDLFELSYGDSFYRFDKSKLDTPTTLQEVRDIIEGFISSSSGHYVKVKVKFGSKFFKEIFDNFCNLRWVDIENLYFDHLCKLKNEAEIIHLNEQFACLTEILEKYLVKLRLDKKDFVPSSYSRIFTSAIRKEDVLVKGIGSDLVPENLVVLNFNYTATVWNYLNHVGGKIENVDHIYIHGELEDDENPIVLGFGDEMDEEYRKFEKLRNNDLFKHIKSFKYSQTSNYWSLIRFVQSDEFQVVVAGHSCGLSDRTMLKEIFEHENCLSIKVYFYKREDGSDDYTDKSYEISRHFEDKGLMRKKLVPKGQSEPLPKPRCR
ncbi:AbiH family protein [Euzebyella saccharophila]|uniref:AbiH family protein n=1 Tax=Euzebyella saccharophila TaxID=679664 RepID=A0ABV8JQX7_9FLAO|nr:AbiH family protein [Euzebyella saccharophila]